MIAQYSQELRINIRPVMLIPFATTPRLPNPILDFFVTQPTHLFGAFADGAATTAQNPRNVDPASVAKLQEVGPADVVRMQSRATLRSNP